MFGITIIGTVSMSGTNSTFTNYISPMGLVGLLAKIELLYLSFPEHMKVAREHCVGSEAGPNISQIHIDTLLDAES